MNLGLVLWEIHTFGVFYNLRSSQFKDGHQQQSV